MIRKLWENLVEIPAFSKYDIYISPFRKLNYLSDFKNCEVKSTLWLKVCEEMNSTTDVFSFNCYVTYDCIIIMHFFLLFVCCRFNNELNFILFTMVNVYKTIHTCIMVYIFYYNYVFNDSIITFTLYMLGFRLNTYYIFISLINTIPTFFQLL